MKMSKRLVAVAICLSLSAAAAVYRAQTAPDIVAAANAFLVSLNAQQLAKVKYDLTHDERMNWYFTPVPRNGLPLKEMESFQRPLAMAMLSAALSQKGFMKATTIMSLEEILRVTETAAAANRGTAAPAAGTPAAGTPAGGGAARGGNQAAGAGGGGGGAGRGGGGGNRITRDPELYFFTIFGTPSTDGAWGWRVEGHHVAVNITMDKGRIVSAGPTFLGTNPALVKEGPRQGLRVLGREEDLARSLYMALDANQKKVALLDVKAPSDIVTMNAKRVEFGTKTQYAMPASPEGLQASKMNARQKEQLMAIIQEYTAGRTSAEYAATTLADIKKAGEGNIYFAWAGSDKVGELHYYRVHGPTFLIEYDNTQNNGNHVHSVFRDLKNDFGVDVLKEHYKTAHGLDN